MSDRPRKVKVHWWRARNLWSVVFSDHCEHYKRLVLKAPMTAELDPEGSPRAYLTGTVRIRRWRRTAVLYS